MMKNTKMIRQLIAATAAVFLGFAAVGATQEWSDTKEFTATETIEDEVNLNGEVAVTVASGKTVTLSNWVHDGTSAGKITLLGGGTLVLAHTNDFTDGAYIDTGVLQVTTGGALGTGDITIKGSTTEMSQLQFGQLDATATKKTITFANNITIENGGSTTYDHTLPSHGEFGLRDTLRYLAECPNFCYFSFLS